jgi:ribosome-binding protein aMBF1 (putative translation factor)
MIPADDVIAGWRKDPAYMKEYDGLEEEFALVAEIIKARAAAGLTQEQIAKRMDTTQAVVARLESGHTMPSTRTLKRFAKATGHRLKITFEPNPTR